MKEEFPHCFETKSFIEVKYVDKIVSDLSNTISADLDLTFDTDVHKFLDKNFPYLSEFLKVGICTFFYRALSRAYDFGGLAACNIIHRHLFEEGEKK